MTCEAIALAELISYIEESRNTGDNIIKLSDVVHLYESRINQLGGDTSKRINGTGLKEKLLTNIPDLEAHKSSYEVILTFKADTEDILLHSTKNDYENDTVVLMRAAKVVRREIFQKSINLEDP